MFHSRKVPQNSSLLKWHPEVADWPAMPALLATVVCAAFMRTSGYKVMTGLTHRYASRDAPS
jgi:hypothetical protein